MDAVLGGDVLVLIKLLLNDSNFLIRDLGKDVGLDSHFGLHDMGPSCQQASEIFLGENHV